MPTDISQNYVPFAMNKGNDNKKFKNTLRQRKDINIGKNLCPSISRFLLFQKWQIFNAKKNDRYLYRYTKVQHILYPFFSLLVIIQNQIKLFYFLKVMNHLLIRLGPTYILIRSYFFKGNWLIISTINKNKGETYRKKNTL